MAIPSMPGLLDFDLRVYYDLTLKAHTTPKYIISRIR